MICVSISQQNFIDCIEAIGKAKMAEIRIDLVKLSELELEKLFKLPIKTIATCRIGYYSENEIIKLLKLAIKSGAKFIDIETELFENLKLELTPFAQKYNTKIIISYHNFEKTPSQKELQKIIKNCFNQGADIVKIACKSNSEKDNLRILDLYKFHTPIVAIGMGEIGKITRVKAIEMGAPFTYASPKIGNKTAEGQIDYETMKKLI